MGMTETHYNIYSSFFCEQSDSDLGRGIQCKAQLPPWKQFLSGDKDKTSEATNLSAGAMDGKTFMKNWLNNRLLELRN